VRFEQRRAAAHAVIDAALLVIPVFAGERALGRGVARDLILHVVQLAAIGRVVLLQRMGGGVGGVVSVHVVPLSGLWRCPVYGGAGRKLNYDEQLTSSPPAQSGGRPA